jgi:hypothetical protein
MTKCIMDKLFIKHLINYDTPNIYYEFKKNIKFENVAKGRDGAILVNNINMIPLVRTTTKYNNPVQSFNEIHYKLMDRIKELDKSYIFNNALIEIYDMNYKTMGFHSDQDLDLQEDSYICIFSCYDKDNKNRFLNIKNKITNEKQEIVLENNSLVIFSTNTNKKNLHQIVYKSSKVNNDSKWLGITFRLSKTFIKFINEIPYFNNFNNFNNTLKIANDMETKEFYKLRAIENNSVDFSYPEINYTISNGDLLQVSVNPWDE